MSLVEELKNLITIRDLFSHQLNVENITVETKQQLQEVVEITTKRIYFILDTLISEDAALKNSNAEKLRDSRSAWFNDLFKTILRVLVAKEIAERVDVVKIFSLWNF